MLKPQHRHSRVRTAAAEPCPNRYALEKLYPCGNRFPCQSLELPNSLNHKVAGIRRSSMREKLEASRLFYPNFVKPVDRLQDRPKFMIPIRAAAEDFQIEINFCERSQCHSSIAAHLTSPINSRQWE